MWPERVSVPGPLAFESDAIPSALRGLAHHESCQPILALYKLHVRVGFNRQLSKKRRFLKRMKNKRP